MKIIEMTRTISGHNFDNLSAKAILDEGDDPMEVGLKLDNQLQTIMEKIIDTSLSTAANTTANDEDDIPF